MRVHLVDATYELFRAHYAPRPAVLGTDDVVLSGVSGLCDQLLFLLREQGATHVGCATDRVIESFRNDLFPGYKSSAGMPRDLLDQFPIAEQAIEALGLTLWPMVEFEADDAIAAAAGRFAADPAVERILICTPDKDMAQLVEDDRIVLWDRRRNLIYDDAGVRAKWGVAPASIPDWLALVGDSADGFPGLPGWGAKSAAAVLAVYGSLEEIPPAGEQVGGAQPPRRAGPRRDAPRPLATRRSCTDRSPGSGPPTTASPIPQQHAGELEWRGAPRATWEAFCDQWGLERLRSRPHRWLEGVARPAASCASREREQRRVVRGRRRERADRSWTSDRGRTTARRPSRSPSRPARSAIRPAAATSQVDIPLCWMNASNRPFAT